MIHVALGFVLYGNRVFRGVSIIQIYRMDKNNLFDYSRSLPPASRNEHALKNEIESSFFTVTSGKCIVIFAVRQSYELMRAPGAHFAHLARTYTNRLMKAEFICVRRLL